jgi:hypothetical protein
MYKNVANTGRAINSDTAGPFIFCHVKLDAFSTPPFHRPKVTIPTKKIAVNA